METIEFAVVLHLSYTWLLTDEPMRMNCALYAHEKKKWKSLQTERPNSWVMCALSPALHQAVAKVAPAPATSTAAAPASASGRGKRRSVKAAED